MKTCQPLIIRSGMPLTMSSTTIWFVAHRHRPAEHREHESLCFMEVLVCRKSPCADNFHGLAAPCRI